MLHENIDGSKKLAWVQNYVNAQYNSYHLMLTVVDNALTGDKETRPIPISDRA